MHTSFLFRGRRFAPLCLILSVCIAALMTVPVAFADPARRRVFNVPADDATMSLKVFAEQSGQEIVYLPHIVKGVRTNAVHGEFVARAAIDFLVKGTDLVVVESKSGALAVSRSAAPNPGRRNGALHGSVSSAATRNLLEGALVEIPALQRQARTDTNGRFTFTDLPAGTHEIVISYLGLETWRERAEISPGDTGRMNVALSSSDVIRLQRFVVATEKEGNALAVTSQRNATNLKNTVALDALGNMPNTNPGELAMRLPGVTAGLDSEGNVNRIQIRGTAAELNRLSIDGNQMSSGFVFDRSFQMHSMSGAMFEQLEVIKGHTPDQSADSIGGTINLKTRSPLALTEKRRLNYSLGARWAPPFFEAAEVRRQHPIHPQINLGYQEVFEVIGGERNLGVSVTAFYNENVNTHDQISYDYQNTTAQPAFIWDYRESTRYSNRRQDAFNLKVEYRHSNQTKLFIHGLYNDGNERFNRIFNTRAFSNQNVAASDAAGLPTGAGAILPGFTSTFTQARGVAGSNFELSTSLFTYFNRTRLIGAGAEHKYDRWEFDYDGSFGRTHNNIAHGFEGPGGQLIMRVPNVGWTLDTTDPANPFFAQTEGASIYDIASYRSAVQQTLRDDPTTSEVSNFKANAQYRLSTRIPLFVKTGVLYRKHEVSENSKARRFDYIGAAPLPQGTVEPTQVEVRGRDLPMVDPATTYNQLFDSALWREDLYYGASRPYSQNRGATEDITAGYIQLRGKFRRLEVIGGVRTERTEVEGYGYVQRRPATAAQIPDPVARAEADWNNPVRNRGSYTRSFPSIHFTYDFTEKVKGRASWSTSFGRPSFLSLIPTAAANETAQTVTISNPGLGPQYSRNTDLALEYYFSATGLVSAGYFRKQISDYIQTVEAGTVGVGADNGYNGDYAGYALLSARNAGDGEISGWEFDYRQQFTFLPGLLKGLGASANYTMLDSQGNFGGTSIVSTERIEGFIPKTGNVGISYNYLGFGARVLMNYTSGYLATAAVGDARLMFRFPRTIVNIGLSYQIRPELKLFCDIANVTGEPQRQYRYIKGRNAVYTRNTPAVTFGVSGQF